LVSELKQIAYLPVYLLFILTHNDRKGVVVLLNSCCFPDTTHYWKAISVNLTSRRVSIFIIKVVSAHHETKALRSLRSNSRGVFNNVVAKTLKSHSGHRNSHLQKYWPLTKI